MCKNCPDVVLWPDGSIAGYAGEIENQPNKYYAELYCGLNLSISNSLKEAQKKVLTPRII